MSQSDAIDPVCRAADGAASLLITPHEKDLGGFSVRRVLPAAEQRTVGPFVFFDEMGPAEFPPGQGINVRPHPHIGLATVTYLFEGQILHRDSLGFEQSIEPGAVNLMTAGRGIVHSERTAAELERSGQRLHGIQTWMALPEDLQEIEPAFVHYPANSLPVIERDGVMTTVVIGDAYDQRSPVQVHPTTLYLDQIMAANATVNVPQSVPERAIYVVEGEVTVGDERVGAGTMAILNAGSVTLEANTTSRLIVAGGEPMGARHLWWNFVHTSRERIEVAKRAWQNGEFESVPGDAEFIPLPK
ncbi:MAG: pirin family protein [Pseudomonadota bacterium]